MLNGVSVFALILRVAQHERKGNSMKEFKLRIRPRPSQSVSIQMPDDVVEALSKVAAKRDMSSEALIKLYIREGLRQDLSHMFPERVFETTAAVLARHLDSPEEISAILDEIREQVVY